MSERHRAAVAAYLILKRDDTVLLVRRCNTGWYDGWYALPAGKVEAGELPIAALIRECQEEIGITLDPADITFAHTMYREGSEHDDAWADYFYIVECGDKYAPYNAEPEKCDDLQWFSIDAFPENMVPISGNATKLALSGEVYSELANDKIQAYWQEYQASL